MIFMINSLMQGPVIVIATENSSYELVYALLCTDYLYFIRFLAFWIKEKQTPRFRLDMLFEFLLLFKFSLCFVAMQGIQ